jgi:hypothetical protein
VGQLVKVEAIGVEISFVAARSADTLYRVIFDPNKKY